VSMESSIRLSTEGEFSWELNEMDCLVECRSVKCGEKNMTMYRCRVCSNGVEYLEISVVYDHVRKHRCYCQSWGYSNPSQCRACLRRDELCGW
jgi:hypothetical protein